MFNLKHIYAAPTEEITYSWTALIKKESEYSGQF